MWVPVDLPKGTEQSLPLESSPSRVAVCAVFLCAATCVGVRVGGCLCWRVAATAEPEEPADLAELTELQKPTELEKLRELLELVEM